MRITSICIFLCVSLIAHLQISLEPTSEEYHRVMKWNNPSIAQIDSIISLSITYNYVNKDTSLILGKKAVQWATQFPNDAIYAKALLELGDSYRIFKDLDEAEVLLKQGRDLYTQLGIEGQVATANNKLGALAKNKGDNEGAIKLYLKALASWEALKDSQNIVKPYINIGAVFNSTNRPFKAIEYNSKALEIANAIGDERAKSYVANNMGIIYNQLAEKYQILIDTSETPAAIYQDSMNYFIEQSLNNYQIALKISKKKNDQRNVIRILNNMTDLNLTMGYTEKALAICKEVRVLALKNGESISMIQNDNFFAEIYRIKKQYPLSLKYAQKALMLATANQMQKEMATSHHELYLTYKELGQYKKALNSFESYKSYIERNGEIERNKSIAEVESKFQNAQKEKQILAKENEILALEASHGRIEKQRNYIIGGFLLLGLLGFIVYQWYKARMDRIDKIAFTEALIYAQEEERKRIARDLHDGIGQSLLLIKKQLDHTNTVTAENKGLIAETLEDVRGISRDLHPIQLQKFGLTSAIVDNLEKIARSSGLFITKDLDDIDQFLNSKSQIHVYRVVQEAFNNIVKHAQATAAKITATINDAGLQITIQDNGKGFDHDVKVARSKSLGLRTMYERISALGGTILISKNQPSGTLITISIPNKP